MSSAHDPPNDTAQAWRNTVRDLLDQELGLGWLERRGSLPEPDGELVLTPGRSETTDKRVPLASVYTKLVSVRDRLRLLEQSINTNTRLSSREKLALQARVTAVHQSLLAMAAGLEV